MNFDLYSQYNFALKETQHFKSHAIFSYFLGLFCFQLICLQHSAFQACSKTLKRTVFKVTLAVEKLAKWKEHTSQTTGFTVDHEDDILMSIY